MTFDEYVEAVVQQGVDRSGRGVRSIQSYIDLRRDMGGAKPAFALLELGLDIPDEVMSHPTIEDMAMASNAMICLSNVSDVSVDMPPPPMILIKTCDRTLHRTT